MFLLRLIETYAPNYAKRCQWRIGQILYKFLGVSWCRCAKHVQQEMEALKKELFEYIEPKIDSV
jgi:hypothetical protein